MEVLSSVLYELSHGSVKDKKSGEINIMALYRRRKEITDAKKE
jgi:hypothetical protein